MRTQSIFGWAAALLLTMLAVVMPQCSCAASPENVRQAAVAGGFYPSDSKAALGDDRRDAGARFCAEDYRPYSCRRRPACRVSVLRPRGCLHLCRAEGTKVLPRGGNRALAFRGFWFHIRL